MESEMTRNLVGKFLPLFVAMAAALAEASAGWAADAPAENGPGSIVMRVVDEAGTSSAAATMTLFRFDPDWRYWKKLDRHGDSDGPSVVRYEGLAVDGSYLVRATTDEGKVAYRECMLSEESQRQEVEYKTRNTAQDNRQNPRRRRKADRRRHDLVVDAYGRQRHIQIE